jgi:hypothetical protein
MQNIIANKQAMQKGLPIFLNVPYHFPTECLRAQWRFYGQTHLYFSALTKDVDNNFD